MGEAILTGYGLFKEKYWFWIGVGALFGYAVVLNILFTMFLTILNRKFMFPYEGQKNFNLFQLICNSFLSLTLIASSQLLVICKLLCPKIKFGTRILGGRMTG